jgi:hypothetical protein
VLFGNNYFYLSLYSLSLEEDDYSSIIAGSSFCSPNESDEYDEF